MFNSGFTLIFLLNTTLLKPQMSPGIPCNICIMKAAAGEFWQDMFLLFMMITRLLMTDDEV